MSQIPLDEFDITLLFKSTDIWSQCPVDDAAIFAQDAGVRIRIEIADSYAIFDNYTPAAIRRGEKAVEDYLTNLGGEKLIGRKRYQRWLNTPYPALGPRAPTPWHLPPKERRDFLDICRSGQPL